MTEAWPLMKGALTWVPGLYRVGSCAAGGSIDARYCYAVWMRHLITLYEVGMRDWPGAVAELGPGLSLGVGLTALLSGSSRYVALDVSRDATRARNSVLLHELATLLEARTSVPDDRAFPEVLPRVQDHAFPSAVALPPDGAARRDTIQELLAGLDGTPRTLGGLSLRYLVPWNSETAIEPVDLALAQAVLEHVDDPAAVYRSLAACVRPGGWLSMAIDFRSHGLTRAWNGHWTYGAPAWSVVVGRRRWGLNRWPLSRHLAALAHAGFHVRRVSPVRRPSEVSAADLARPFRGLPPADLDTCGAYIAAQRR